MASTSEEQQQPPPPPPLGEVLRRAGEQHERLRQRFMFTAMPGLLDAAKAGDQAGAQRLLASGADPDVPVEIVYLPRNASASTTACRWSPMHFACAGGHEAVVAALLVAGARGGHAASGSPDCNTPLAVAERHGHLRCALLLQLSQGALRDEQHLARTATVAVDSSVSHAVSALESRWATQLREMNADNAELRRRAEWAEGILQRQVRAVATEPTQLPIEEGEAPAGRVGAPTTQPQHSTDSGSTRNGTGAVSAAAATTENRVVETALGRRRVCPVCMDSPRNGAMVPCGHTACVGCASQLEMHRGTCAECNATIEMVLPLFGV
jgi:hypothetical protein